MERVSLNEVDRWMSPAQSKRSLSNALGAEHLAVNHYILEPGESFGFGYHRHADQEELFYVLEGTATFETEEGDVTVSAEEAIRFAPGEWQLGRNETDERVVALALGAPAETGETDIRRLCPDCGERQLVRIEPTADRDALVAICEECGAETVRHS
ncbi:cupin domain-containing protein [Natrinema hispanicum]|uniref:Cupin domain-containing protein n=1 Tax=Natrinema hispanicum TaxID=392421 RepID=A0A1I0B267_9EURY|nr:cupin domain-containing protein [Natrinema hispanicum]SDC39449.1 Cupin domain-containing protein [Natrinema hispanicum]SET00829.1 Cupin domain-containing protein [Natrinema hispanicum]